MAGSGGEGRGGMRLKTDWDFGGECLKEVTFTPKQEKPDGAENQREKVGKTERSTQAEGPGGTASICKCRSVWRMAGWSTGPRGRGGIIVCEKK